MSADAGDQLLQFACQSFPTSCFVTYEQILPNDPFGKVMIQNLKVLVSLLQLTH